MGRAVIMHVLSYQWTLARGTELMIRLAMVVKTSATSLVASALAR